MNKIESLVYKVIAADSAVTRTDLVEALGFSIRTIDMAIRLLKDKGVIKRIGSDKTGHW